MSPLEKIKKQKTLFEKPKQESPQTYNSIGCEIEGCDEIVIIITDKNETMEIRKTITDRAVWSMDELFAFMTEFFELKGENPNWKWEKTSNASIEEIKSHFVTVCNAKATMQATTLRKKEN